MPDELLGCWQRQWIEFEDGTRDDTSFVVRLQLSSLMADVRLSAAALALAGRTAFSFDEWAVVALGARGRCVDCRVINDSFAGRCQSVDPILVVLDPH